MISAPLFKSSVLFICRLQEIPNTVSFNSLVTLSFAVVEVDGEVEEEEREVAERRFGRCRWK